MKSKVTLIILIVIIVILGGTTIFLGYKYSQKSDEVVTLSSELETTQGELEEYKDTTTTEAGEVIEVETVVEKYAIAKIDDEKIDGDYATVEAIPRQVSIIGATVTIGDSSKLGASSTGSHSGEVFVYNDVNYTFDGREIVDAIQGIYGNAGTFAAVLLEDGTVQYCIPSGQTLEFKTVDLTGAVKILNVKVYNSENQLLGGKLAVITSDGVTHIIEFE